jgi:hypothetical protein
MGLYRSLPATMRINIYRILLLTICSNRKMMATHDLATSSSSSLLKMAI